MITSTMKLMILLVFSVTMGYPRNLSAQQTARKTYHESWVGYLEYLPPDYNEGTEKFPLLIYLHGGGEVGDGTPESLQKLKSWGPPSLADNFEMCFTVNGKRQCFIILSPQLNKDFYNWATTVERLMDHAQNGPEAYRVDWDRVYLSGMSRGGLGVYEFAASAFNAPNRLAAMAPIAAWIDNASHPCAIAERDIPIWAFHGRLDTVVPHELGLSAFNWIKNCVEHTVDAEMIFTTYDDRYHDSWIPAYDPSNTIHTLNLYQWFLTQKRKAPPPPGPVTGITGSSGESFSIHPNPAREEISLSFKNEPGFVQVEIITATGRIALTTKVRDQIDIAALPPGMYFLRINQQYQGRFIKMN